MIIMNYRQINQFAVNEYNYYASNRNYVWNDDHNNYVAVYAHNNNQ